jgi:mono/diheme cytochrome c family protein
MPKLLRGTKAKEDADAMAAFLVAQKESAPPKENKPTSSEQTEAGKRLFDTLHCTACHNAPDTSESDTAKISLRNVRSKFAPDALSQFLLKPEAHYVWTRMPNFNLKPDEADGLAAFLNSVADKPAEDSVPTDGATIDRGKKLVQTTGCLNCHALKFENQFKTKSLADLPADKWTRGCLSERPAEVSKSPQFAFTSTEREALQAFAATDRASLTRHVPAEFAERQSRLLNCRECHGKVEGIPSFDILGEKLKPEWTAKFLAGRISYKPRPWLESRMPAFALRADSLAQGLAIQHGFPPVMPAEPPIDMDAAKVGQKLVSAAGGFSCVTCHGVGDVGENQVFETPGLNLAHSGKRLLKPYFQRWVRNPIQIDPATKMPVYFDENGKSPLTDFYDGNGEKTINAIWQYLRLGEKMPPPPTP